MPFKSPKLGDEQIRQLAKWIDLGAPFDTPLSPPPENDRASDPFTDADRQFWSFQPLKRPAIPPDDPDGWCRTPIDRFIWARLSDAGIAPNATADRRVLIRRAYYDLIGLPPTHQEVEQFVADADPQAYARVLDRLLQSQHHGERWARHWLDVARFAESSGYEHDDDRPNAYPYRDFVIKALNADLPYDEFVRWQLAGDELAPDNPLAMSATGFLGTGTFPTQLTEAEFESARYDELDEMVANTGLAFLGLSIGCARCHDHKFDPIPSADYYAFAATFVKTVRSEIDLVLAPASPPAKVQVTAEGFAPLKNHADGRGYPYFYEHVHILRRGDVQQKEGVAEPGFVRVLMRSDGDPARWNVSPPLNWSRTEFRRAALANWITDPERGAGHLAARVIVNRLWQHHFGRGLVATPNDFGMQGERPTHPELLDWLACELIDGGWSLKQIHRLIMTSAVYTQNASYDEARAAVDPGNQLHWRRTPRRLEAEAIRDAMLSVSGLLDPTMYGPGSLDETMHRRSIYFTVKRSKLIPTMMLFDWPEHLVSVGQRPVTTTAPQALWFINNAQIRQYALGFAHRLTPKTTGGAIDSPQDDQVIIARAYRIAYGRAAAEEELNVAEAFLHSQRQLYAHQEEQQAAEQALADLCQMILGSSEFIYLQ